jgi:hypothetical protein
VFDGTRGFIGLRTKFDSTFLFTEYHWDTGEPHGTVKPTEDLGIDLPEGISIEETLGQIDARTKQPVVYDEENSQWVYLDGTKAASMALSVNNTELQGWLCDQIHEDKKRG